MKIEKCNITTEKKFTFKLYYFPSLPERIIIFSPSVNFIYVGEISVGEPESAGKQ